MAERQINEIEEAIITAKAEQGERYTIKELEKTRKSLQARLDKLNDTSRKDDVVTFEQLGVDRLFVDEATLSYAEIKAVATGNPMIKEKMEIDNDVQRLKMLKSTYDSQHYAMQDRTNA